MESRGMSLFSPNRREFTANRTGGRADVLLTSDEHAPYETAIRQVYGVETPRPRRPGSGHPPQPMKVVPADLCYATVRKRREK
jgi:hypothetical protein